MVDYQIETSRFILRPFSKSDATDVVSVLSNRKISEQFENFPIPYKISDAKKWLEKIKKEGDSLRFAIEIKKKLVGSVQLFDIKNNSAMLGFWLEEKHWGNGISTEALGILLKIAKSYQIKKVLAETFKDNLASQKVLEKNGFVKSGEVKRKDKTIYKYQKIII